MVSIKEKYKEINAPDKRFFIRSKPYTFLDKVKIETNSIMNITEYPINITKKKFLIYGLMIYSRVEMMTMDRTIDEVRMIRIYPSYEFVSSIIRFLKYSDKRPKKKPRLKIKKMDMIISKYFLLVFRNNGKKNKLKKIMKDAINKMIIMVLLSTLYNKNGDT